MDEREERGAELLLSRVLSTVPFSLIVEIALPVQFGILFLSFATTGSGSDRLVDQNRTTFVILAGCFKVVDSHN